ncbi:MAG: hypothetical protein ACI80V_003564 [Rhodothermales bacterium]|jgi:hypothetical protein
MNPRVKKVSPREGHTLAIEFSNGEVGVYDCTPLLGHGIFKELTDATYFGRAFVHGGTVAWPNNQDICPDTIYEDSVRTVGQTSVERA